MGALRFSDGSQERALGYTLSARLWNWLDISVNPTYAWTQYASVEVSPGTFQQGRRVNGFTDLPISIGISRAESGAWSPFWGIALGATLPIGDPETLGAGQAAVGANLFAGVQPAKNFFFDVAAGRSISDGYAAGLASSSSTSLSATISFRVARVGLNVSFTGDVGSVPDGFESARSIAGGLSIPVSASTSVNVDASGGLTHGSPSWAYSIGIGTTPAGIVAAFVAPWERLQDAFGAGTQIKAKPRTKPKKFGSGS
jgi:hypothetical protein